MIVLVAPRLGFHGGVEKHVHDLAHGLRCRNKEVALVYIDSGRDPEAYARPFTEAVPLGRAARLLKEASHVYVHKVDDSRVFSLVPAGVPLSFAVHDHDATCVRSHRYVPIGREPCVRAPGACCYRQGCVVVRSGESRIGFSVESPFALARRTRAIARRGRLVACSAFVRRTLLDAGVPAERVRVVHPVPPGKAEEPKPAPDAHVLAFGGQIIRGKGLDLVISALPQLPGTSLLVAGDGNDREYVERLAERLGVARQVEFKGPLPPDAMASLYDSARVVVVPSRWPEPFGMVGVEAMRRGRPVVAAWHGGIPEWLNHDETGFGFRPADVEDLASALRRALEPDTHRRLSEGARARSQQAFLFEQMMDRLADWVWNANKQEKGDNHGSG